MAHVNFFPSKTYFYPIGNTAPVSLAEHVAPDGDADFLLLGCGDPRNVLYTIYSTGLDKAIESRKFDFTCVDIEPAILARNILMLSLILSDEYSEQAQSIWDIFYHFLLDDVALALLIKQSQKLAHLSSDYDTWRGGEYSSFIEIGNRSTLEDLHHLWTKYAATGTWAPAQKAQFKKTFVSEMNAISEEKEAVVDWTVTYSAGPLAIYATAATVEANRHFWKTGTTYTAPSKVKAATHVNPTFAYVLSRESLVAHYATMPLTAFHLAPAFTTTTERPNQGAKLSPNDLFKLARAQFRLWCDAFRSCLETTSVAKLVIRVLTCDALGFCRALRNKSSSADPSTFPRVSPSRAAILALDGPAYTNNTAPLRFDIIDTSNLGDYLGILNILIATSSLLKRLPSSVVYTVNVMGEGEDPIATFSDILCGDVPTMCLLLDLSPLPFITGYTTSSNIHETMSYHRHTPGATSNRDVPYHERVAWKILSQLGGLNAPLSFEPFDLARLLFNVYLSMFAMENMSATFRSKLTQAFLGRRLHYCRATFVLFIASIMDRIAVDWNEAIKRLVQHILEDKTLIMGISYSQELTSLLHTQRIYYENLHPPGHPLLVRNKDVGPFRNWLAAAIPPMCSITLSVPRTAFKLLYEDGALRIPIIALEFCKFQFINVFLSVDMMFGTISVEGEGENAKGIINEDPLGSRGTQPMLVSGCVPSWILADDPANTSLAAKVVAAPTTTDLSSKLGVRMWLHKAPLVGSGDIYVFRDRPSTSRDIRAGIPYATTYVPAAASRGGPSIGLDSSGQRIATMARRIQFHDSSEQAALASKDNPIVVKQVGPSTIQVSIGYLKPRLLSFPCVIGGTNLRTRIARKSSWIEVVAQPTLLREDDVEGGISRRFPVVSCGSSFLPWNIPRVYPDRLPTLSTSDTRALAWTSPHVTLAFSDRERKAREAHMMDPLAHLKNTLHVLFMRASGAQDGVKVDVFGLHKTTDGDGIDTILFVTDIKLDLPNHSIALDAFVLPLDPLIAFEVVPALPRGLAGININDEEHLAWKTLLPSLVERCRTWEHKPDCAYKRPGATIPLTTEPSEVPICGCGRGEVTDAFRRRKEWLPFLPYVTRVAISPLFAVSYVEPVGGDIPRVFGARLSAARNSGPRAPPASEPTADGNCRICKVALSGDKQLRCSKCKRVTYCGRACQVKDWKNHKASCKA